MRILMKHTLNPVITFIESHMGIMFMHSLELKKVLNTRKIKLEYLHPLVKRWRRFVRHQKGAPVNPIVYKITTLDGRNYKLFKSEKADSPRHLIYISNLLKLSHMDFVPRLIYHDDRHIIIEYIDGPYPDLSSDEFSKEFGRCLGKLHNISVGELSAKEVLLEVLENLNDLVALKIICNKIASTIYRKIELLLPKKIHTSMTYTDLKQNSFCFDKAGRLFFYDIGSFERKCMTDEFLLGSKIFQKINLDIFIEEYLAYGGLSDLLERKKFLEPINNINMSVYLAKRLALTSKTKVLRYRLYKRELEERIKFLINFANSK